MRLFVARSVTYTMLLLVLAAMYILGAFEITEFLRFLNGGNAGLPDSVVNVPLALLLAFTFQPLRRFFERITDRIFYQDRYDSQVVLNKFSQILVSELELDRLMRRSLVELCRDIHVEYSQIVIFHHDRVYRIEHYGPLPKKLMIVPQLRQLNKALLVADELETGEQKQLMDGHGIRVSLELRTREEHIGYLLLGDKLSGGIYAVQDLKLLEIISKELAVAISNAKAYAEIQAFNLTLQQRVDHATSRLRVANRHLKELDRAKDEFISMASHQLRTPLTTVKGYLSMMLEGDVGKLNPAQTDFTSYAFGASERMVNLISDLLNVSRLSAGRFLIQTRPTDMVELVNDEVRQLQSHALAKHLVLKFEHPDTPLVPAEIDDGKTRQVIMNFIDNAIYYTKEGSVTVRLEQTATSVRLTVSDTGIGVPKAEQRKLFAKFYRAQNAQAIRPDGTGLGLYLARRVIEDQGGTILFESTEGKGSTFGFELPLKPAPKPRKAKETHGRTTRSQ